MTGDRRGGEGVEAHLSTGLKKVTHGTHQTSCRSTTVFAGLPCVVQHSSWQQENERCHKWDVEESGCFGSRWDFHSRLSPPHCDLLRYFGCLHRETELQSRRCQPRHQQKDRISESCVGVRRERKECKKATWAGWCNVCVGARCRVMLTTTRARQRQSCRQCIPPWPEMPPDRGVVPPVLLLLSVCQILSVPRPRRRVSCRPGDMQASLQAPCRLTSKAQLPSHIDISAQQLGSATTVDQD